MTTMDVPSAEPQTVSNDLPVSILSKAFYLLSAFGPEHRVLTLTQISHASGLPKSTVHRLIGRLMELGVIEPHGPGFKVGIRLKRLASPMPVECLRESALPHLASLHRWSKGHVHLAALRSDRVVFVERFLGQQDTLPSSSPGVDLPVHTTAVGKALLAHVTPEEVEEVLGHPLIALTPNTVTDSAALEKELRHARSDRVAFARGESHPDISCVAAPVITKGRAVGAISVSTAFGGGFGRQLIDAVRVTAERVGRDNERVLAQGHEDWFHARD